MPLARSFAAGLITTLLCGCAPNAAASALVQREVKEKSPGGKNLEITFREVRRDDRTSLVKVVLKSGGSVTSSVFLVCSFREIAKARGTRYFVNLKEWNVPEGGRMYLIGFSDDATVPIAKYFSFTEPPSVPDEHEFVGVDQFSPLCK